MGTFFFGALGALLPELHRWLSLRSDITSTDVRINRVVLLSGAITVAWLVAAGLFALALPGPVASLTAVYAGLSLPATIGLALRRPLSNVDTIELEDEMSSGELLRFLLTRSWHR